ncbi:hypothetical protein OG239_42685 (plasmid) [Streptomyces sp. NBC_00868]|uniref:hypothetical protein n=1 Tax=Streptomyces sp. NBC_00868 TaxID=2903683 RepID=UPI002F919C46|nr:hypothetical protein OG239_42685 [Streptomyces sp. NBC_00868]
MSQPTSTPPQDPAPAPQQPIPPATDSGAAALLPLLVLVFVLLVLVIGAGLLYVTIAHPSLAMPLTVAAAGVTIVFTIAGVLVAIAASSRR